MKGNLLHTTATALVLTLMGAGAVNAEWAQGGIPVCTAAGVRTAPRIVSDGSGGAIVAWEEYRSGDRDIYAQRISSDGSLRWVDDVVVASCPRDIEGFSSVSDGAGGAIITWLDRRTGYDIYAVRIDSEGIPPPVTKLDGYTACAVGYGIVVEWTLAQAAKAISFSIGRSMEPDTVFQPINDPVIIEDGLSFRFMDRKLDPSTTCRYRVIASDDEGVRTLFTTDPITTPPLPLTLYQNHPNPFGQRTTIYYYLPGPARVILCVYDVTGRRVITVFDGWKGRGHHEEPWDGCGAYGDPLPAGVYFCRLETPTGSSQRKMVLIR